MNDYTHITMVLDRSGSMESIRHDVIGGVNAFVSVQKDAPGRATFSLIQFDSQNPYEVIHDAVPMAEVPALTADTFRPRASTPLLDALGKTIQRLELKLADWRAEERPGKVIIVVMTDGQENASRRYSAKRIRDLIKVKEQLLGWEFVFLSSDLRAVNDSHHQGIAPSKSMFVSDVFFQEAIEDLASNVRAYRVGEKPDLEWKDSDRAKHS